jgi:hypothetical protein
MVDAPRFQELQSLPYVTLTLSITGNRQNYYHQWHTEVMCLSEETYAAKHDWALLADIDEYLWFPEHIGVKEFLSRQTQLTYLSFGKRMYTLDHRTDMKVTEHTIDTVSNGFAVSRYPFYIDNFCYHKGFRRGETYCPMWRGRAKVMVRPKFHTNVETHGNIPHPDPANGTIHFHPDQAHLMEWPEIFAKHNVTKRKATYFTVRTDEEVHIHNLDLAFKADHMGNFRMQHDDNLDDWFRFVTSRFSAGQ